MSGAKELRERPRLHEDSARAVKEQLRSAEKSCAHKWGDTEYAPLHHCGYEIPGDAPGTMGVDWRGPTWVPGRTEKRWRRECARCGLQQETRRTAKKSWQGPVPGVVGEFDMPVFEGTRGDGGAMERILLVQRGSCVLCG